MAIAAADPSPAAVMTWARGSATLPATHTPGTLVGPSLSVTGQPSLVEVATETGEQVAVGDEARRDEQRVAGDSAVVQLDAAQAVVLDDDPLRVALDDADPRATSCCRSAPSASGRREVHEVVGPLPDDLGVVDCRRRAAEHAELPVATS